MKLAIRSPGSQVLARDGNACVCCGTSVDGFPFAIRRRSPDGGDSPANLITVAGTKLTGCLERMASGRDRCDAEMGYVLEPGADPETIPVTIVTPEGGHTVFLTRSGQVSTAPPDKGGTA